MPTITIDVTAAQAARIVSAYGLGGSNTDMLDKIAWHLKQELIRVVRNHEHQEAVNAVSVPPLDI